MEVPGYVLSKLGQWNKAEPTYDNRFVAALLLCLTEPEKLITNDVPEEVFGFVYGMSAFRMCMNRSHDFSIILLLLFHFEELFKIRCGNHCAIERLDKLTDYVKEICDAKHKEAEKKNQK